MSNFKSGKKYGESIYDWCVRIGFTELLERWDTEKNGCTPKEVTSTKKSYWFKCENGLHDSELRSMTTIAVNHKVPGCSVCNSFGVWCENHARMDLLKRWDYEKNNCTPYEVSHASEKKYWFKCPRGLHPSEAKAINNVIGKFGSSKCVMCQSFAQWGEDELGQDFLEKYWSDKNESDPWKIYHGSQKKIWIKCQEKEYHPDYETTCASFSNGHRCPYCHGFKVAKEDSLGYKYPESIKLWVEKKTTPYDYMPSSNKKVYWNCEKHGQYKRAVIDEVEAGFVCPKCRKEMAESKLQKKVREYIESLYDDIRHEYSCTIVPINPKTNYKLPFDNEIVPLKLII